VLIIVLSATTSGGQYRRQSALVQRSLPLDSMLSTYSE